MFDEHAAMARLYRGSPSTHIRYIKTIELALMVTNEVVAAFMARGAWLF